MRIVYSRRLDGSIVATGTGRWDHQTHYMTWDCRTGDVYRDAQPRPVGLHLSESKFHVQVETMLECDEYSIDEPTQCVVRRPVLQHDGTWAVACGCGHWRDHGPSRSSLVRLSYLHYNERNLEAVS